MYLLLFRAGWRRLGQAASVVGDLRVEQLEAFPLAGDGPPDLLAVPLEQADALVPSQGVPGQAAFPAASPMVQVVTTRAYELERALTQMPALAGGGAAEGHSDPLEAEGGEHAVEHPGVRD